MRSWAAPLAAVAAVFLGLVLLHLSLIHLPYFWDEAGYYVPAALDFYRHGLLIPRTTAPSGHPPLVMVYLGLVWRLFGFTEVVTRMAMLVVAAASVVATYMLACEVAGCEVGIWGATLLALSPLFFAQSSLVLLDLPVACFTALAVLFLLQERWFLFALASTCAVLSKETAVVMLPIVWVFMLISRNERRLRVWAALVSPTLPLGAWALYYHHQTGFWTGNPQYLQYNLYSAFTPFHIVRSFVARCYEVLVQGFNWVLTAGAVVGIWWMKRSRRARKMRKAHDLAESPNTLWSPFTVLALSITCGYVLMLSFVGGAVLSRYMLPVVPLYILVTLDFMRQLPTFLKRTIIVVAMIAFVAGWFINPPYPFPYEDNLAYADFIRLHQETAKYLESLPGDPVILTAWPATDELRQPRLGYVPRPLRVAQVEAFTAKAFKDPPQFDVLYAYSRKWAPKPELLVLVRPIRKFLERFYDYRQPISMAALAAQLHLKLSRSYERHGQWVRLYARREPKGLTSYIRPTAGPVRTGEHCTLAHAP
jgi:hypothetical protein